MEDQNIPVVIIDNLCVQYGNDFQLGPITYSLNKGAILGILGNNGSGKSTLMHCIVNFISDYEGEVVVNANKIGFCFQTPSFYPNKTVFENLRVLSLNKQVKTTEIKDALDFFNLSTYKNKPFKVLSGGNKKRVEIILAILGSPELILFDEPTANLDEPGVELFNQSINLLKDKSTIIINNHNSSELRSYCTDFMVLQNGSMVEAVNKENFNHVTYIDADDLVHAYSQ